MFYHWNRESIKYLFNSYRFADAWSSWFLEIFILVFFFITLRLDISESEKPFSLYSVSAMTSGIFTMFWVNAVACLSHGIDKVDNLQYLGNALRYFNFGLLGFVSVWMEFFILSRVRFLAKIAGSNIKNFPFGFLTSLIILKLLAFQYFNWVTRSQPRFIYAVYDYGTSLLMMFFITVYIIIKVPANFSIKLEKYLMAGIIILFIAAFAQSSPLIVRLFPFTKESMLNYDDIYHLITVFGLYFVFTSRKWLKSV
jgi:hypothetical protein